MLQFNSKTISIASVFGMIKQLFLHFFFPRTCLACGCDLPRQSEGFLCPACESLLKEPGPLICQRCGVVLKSGGAHCYACRGSKSRAYKCACIRSAFEFNASSRALVHALKYTGFDYVAPVMGAYMAEKFVKYPELADAEIVMPVPLFPKKHKKRGYNQSECLARTFSEKTGIVMDTRTLVRSRDTVSQTTLGRSGRLANMTGAFACVRPQVVKGKTLLLIDDVATTGATLEGCAVALKQAGAKKVLAFTFARE